MKIYRFESFCDINFTTMADSVKKAKENVVKFINSGNHNNSYCDLIKNAGNEDSEFSIIEYCKNEVFLTEDS